MDQVTLQTPRTRTEELPPVSSIVERLVLAILRMSAGTVLLNGFSVVVAVLPALAFAPADGLVRSILATLAAIAGAFVVAGTAARYLYRSRRVLLANERIVVRDLPSLAGWPLVLLASLLLLALSASRELAPLRALWAEMLTLARESGLSDALRTPDNSGLVLLPVGAALAVPLLQLFTGYLSIASAALLSLLVFLRSCRLPRVYLGCVLVQAALVFASLCTVGIVRGVTTWIADEAGRTMGFVNSMETAQVLDAMERYTSVLATSARSLALVLVGFAVWLFPLLASRWVRETFAIVGRVDDDGSLSGGSARLARQCLE